MILPPINSTNGVEMSEVDIRRHVDQRLDLGLGVSRDGLRPDDEYSRMLRGFAGDERLHLPPTLLRLPFALRVCIEFGDEGSLRAARRSTLDDLRLSGGLYCLERAHLEEPANELLVGVGVND